MCIIKGFKTFDEVQREEEERQQQEEDEAVDELKQEIRFTKQSSVASTRNTLKMAQEAEMAGMNTLGMLGHQSEKLNNVERNLDLIKIQNDEMEVEIDRNLSQIQQVSGRLKKLAISAGEEIDAQQQRLDRVENNTDDLDIKINMNTNKLSYIK